MFSSLPLYLLEKLYLYLLIFLKVGQKDRCLKMTEEITKLKIEETEMLANTQESAYRIILISCCYTVRVRSIILYPKPHTSHVVFSFSALFHGGDSSLLGTRLDPARAHSRLETVRASGRVSTTECW